MLVIESTDLRHRRQPFGPQRDDLLVRRLVGRIGRDGRAGLLGREIVLDELVQGVLHVLDLGIEGLDRRTGLHVLEELLGPRQLQRLELAYQLGVERIFHLGRGRLDLLRLGVGALFGLGKLDAIGLEEAFCCLELVLDRRRLRHDRGGLRGQLDDLVLLLEAPQGQMLLVQLRPDLLRRAEC